MEKKKEILQPIDPPGFDKGGSFQGPSGYPQF